jgi:hypothetical protein
VGRFARSVRLRSKCNNSVIYCNQPQAAPNAVKSAIIYQYLYYCHLSWKLFNFNNTTKQIPKRFHSMYVRFQFSQEILTLEIRLLLSYQHRIVVY